MPLRNLTFCYHVYYANQCFFQAYIGFFCGQASLALMARENVTGLNEWNKFFNHYAIIHIIPGVIGGSIIYGSIRTFRHMAVLPACIVLLMVAFYTVLRITGTSVEEATENGWINESTESQNWKHTWDFLRIDKVVWSVLPSQIGTLLAMISVVALSSSLDVAAIEIELKRPLDYNHELSTVGISNVISGVLGGYTGSYIFSQTIFSLRMGIRSRLMGYVISCLSIVAVIIPFNILSYVPNLFFGSLLMLICLDLMFEWLIDVRSKLTSAEYIVVLATFGLLQVLGVEFGILAGVVFYFSLKKMGFAVG
jgi:SulP family sulfate permease